MLLAEANNTNCSRTYVPTQICADLISLFIQNVIVAQMGISSVNRSLNNSFIYSILEVVF